MQHSPAPTKICVSPTNVTNAPSHVILTTNEITTTNVIKFNHKCIY